jgi:Tfp pilus assembly PilM family ATPase
MLCKELDIDEREARTMLERGKTTNDTDAIADTDGAEQNIPVTDAFYSVLKPLFMELVEDINRALIYAASETRGVPVKHVYLTDRVATWHGIENFINTLIEVPVSVMTPYEGFENAEMFNADSGPRSAVVTGMALHGLTEYG